MTLDMHPSTGLKEAIEQRRAARAFRSDPIPEAILTQILELGVQAPSGFNLQPWRFIVVKQQANRDQLKACAFNQNQIGEAPVVLICCGDRRAGQTDNIESVIQLSNEVGMMTDDFANYMRSSIPGFFANHPSYESIEAWINRHVMLAVAQIMIVAKSFGVDSCPMEGFSTDQVKQSFNIPAEVDVCCLVPLGYATEPLKQYGGRYSLDRVCFSESYGKAF